MHADDLFLKQDPNAGNSRVAVHVSGYRPPIIGYRTDNRDGAFSTSAIGQVTL